MIRFAFYGRVSTEDQQDPESSRSWQLTRSRALIEARGGVIVTEFFDVDKSRSIPWQRRPQATALLGELRNKNRDFDAVVIGEPHRAFYGNQYGLTFPLFEHYGVPLWVPEVGGPIDPTSEAHDLVMSVFGGMSKGERNRVMIRVRTAMAAQAQVEGRFLGGRPPYGYMLVDAGPHPNPAKAADGKRLHALAPDPQTARVVGRIFAEYLAGMGLKAIAESLTRDDIPSPSAYDPARNKHRCGIAWSWGAVGAILANPRYTGRQVWNKQPKSEVLIDVDDVGLGHTTRQTWNEPDKWIWSEQPVHEPLVGDEVFKQVQALRRAKGSSDERSPRRTARPYALRGIVRCGICGRKMQGTWNNGRPHYRCMFLNQYAAKNKIQHPPTFTCAKTNCSRSSTHGCSASSARRRSRRPCANCRPPSRASRWRMRPRSARSPNATPSCASSAPRWRRAPTRCSSRAGSRKRRPSALSQRRGCGSRPGVGA
jgi:DNA invertase Pin-like site-specific DNA recombinase